MVYSLLVKSLIKAFCDTAEQGFFSSWHLSAFKGIVGQKKSTGDISILDLHKLSLKRLVILAQICYSLVLEP